MFFIALSCVFHLYHHRQSVFLSASNENRRLFLLWGLTTLIHTHTLLTQQRSSEGNLSRMRKQGENFKTETSRTNKCTSVSFVLLTQTKHLVSCALLIMLPESLSLPLEHTTLLTYLQLDSLSCHRDRGQEVRKDVHSQTAHVRKNAMASRAGIPPLHVNRTTAPGNGPPPPWQQADGDWFEV